MNFCGIISLDQPTAGAEKNRGLSQINVDLDYTKWDKMKINEQSTLKGFRNSKASSFHQRKWAILDGKWFRERVPSIEFSLRKDYPCWASRGQHGSLIPIWGASGSSTATFLCSEAGMDAIATRVCQTAINTVSISFRYSLQLLSAQRSKWSCETCVYESWVAWVSEWVCVCMFVCVCMYESGKLYSTYSFL